MLDEFKKFLIKGNAIDMAVGFIFGAAFASVIKSLIANIIMPPIGMVTGGMDFSDMVYTLMPKTETADAVVMKYGIFMNDVFAFIILGFVIFMMVRTINNLQKKEEAKPAPAKKSAEVEILEKILKAVKK